MATQRTMQRLCYHCSSITHLFCMNLPDCISYHNEKTDFALVLFSPLIHRNKMGRAEAVANVKRCSYTQVSA